MSDKIKLKICLPSNVYKDIEVEKVQLPAFNGDITILSDRAPSIFVLKPGFIRILTENNKIQDRYFIEGGVAEFSNSVCKVMVEKITEYSHVNIEEFASHKDIIDIINLEKTREG